MVLFVILNIVVVGIILMFDLYKNQFQSFRFSSALLAIAINSFLNQILLGKVTFISLAAMFMYIAWTIIHFYVDRQETPFKVYKQKFLLAIFTIMVSMTLLITYQTGDESYYMSVPFAAPTIFIFGGILFFSSSFHSPYFQNFYKKIKVKNPLWIGTFFMILGLTVLSLLTPQWYVILTIHFCFFVLITLEKLYKI
ncbi:hypothetical protein G8Y85_07530 [Staphylococcus sp. 11007852]|uniref:hypothetical protein n=1 Tax=Staphylococcus TaxID=1279 RepID=UPI001402534D|nr:MULTISPECIES: hypothetical protein [Staphylococcus]NHM75252.1 hypothetical protein [Staphylococcus sp. 11007852]NJH83650.1 hypothetical protein [Staphylococcus agnetis]